MAYYGRGDYYSGMRGDYYRGDPFLGGLLSAALPLVGKAVGWVGSKLGGTAGSAIARGAATGVAAAAVPLAFNAMEGQGGIRIGKRVIHPTAILPGGKPFITQVRRYRRMNVLNPKALRRALRRAEGFEKFARRTVTALHHGPKKFKSTRRRSA